MRLRRWCAWRSPAASYRQPDFLGRASGIAQSSGTASVPVDALAAFQQIHQEHSHRLLFPADIDQPVFGALAVRQGRYFDFRTGRKQQTLAPPILKTLNGHGRRFNAESRHGGVECSVSKRASFFHIGCLPAKFGMAEIAVAMDSSTQRD